MSFWHTAQPATLLFALGTLTLGALVQSDSARRWAAAWSADTLRRLTFAPLLVIAAVSIAAPWRNG